MNETKEPDFAVSYVRKVATGQFENVELRATSRVTLSGFPRSLEEREKIVNNLCDEVVKAVHSKLTKITGKVFEE